MFLDEGFIPCHPELLRKCSWIRVYLVIRFVKKKGVLGWSTYHTKKPLGIRGHQYAWELYEIYIRNLILPCFIVNFSKYLCLSLLFFCFIRYVCSVFFSISDFLLRKYNIFRVSTHATAIHIWLFYLVVLSLLC